MFHEPQNQTFRIHVRLKNLCNQIIQLSLEEQKQILIKVLANLSNAYMQTIFIKKNKLSDNEKYILLSALVARYEWIKHAENNGSLCNVVLPDMPTYWTEQEKALVYNMIFDQIKVFDPNTDIKGININAMLGYLKNLPFPLNSKCLSEALNAGTPWNSFFEKMVINETDAVLDMNLLCYMQLNNELHLANKKAFTDGQLVAISPEIATIVGYPDLVNHASKILRLLQEEELSDVSIGWIRAEGTRAKTAVLDFISAIPDDERKGVYRTMEISHLSPLAQFLNTKTRLEQISEIPRQALRRALAWMSPIPNGDTTSNATAQEFSNIGSTLLLPIPRKDS